MYIDQVKSSDLNSSELNQWITNQGFYGIVPTNLFVYYNKVIKTFDYWTTTYDPSFHNDKISPTRLANAICEIEANTVFGENLIYTAKDALSEMYLDGINKWSMQTQFPLTVLNSFYEAARFGTSLLKINKNRKYGYVVECVPMNRYWCSTDSLGKVTSASMFIDTYRAANDENYMLYEERAKVKGKCYVSYKIYKTVGEMGKTFERNYVGYLPVDVARYYLENYGVVKNGMTVEIPSDNIQCYQVKWSGKNPKIQSVAYGESALSDIMADLQMFDIIYSQTAIELYLGRPRALLPMQMARTITPNKKITKTDNTVSGGTLTTSEDTPSAMAAFNNQKSWVGLDPTMYDIIPNISTDAQKPEFFQAQLQSDKLDMLLTRTLKTIATKRQYSARLLDGTLGVSTGNVTATQITAEEAPTLNFISKKLLVILPTLNEVIDEILRLAGIHAEIDIEMNNINSRNMLSYLTELQIKSANGWEKDEDIIRALHPTATEQQIRELIAENIKKGAKNEERGIEKTF